MRNLRLILAFDGTTYHGWQMQANAVTVQSTLLECVCRITGGQPNIIGCSRTDAGVHARAFCCNFKTESAIPCGRLVAALNSYLPDDICVKSCDEVPADFHARYSCTSKEYVYRIRNSAVPDPFDYRYTLRYRHPLDENRLAALARAFVGRHDFAAFCAAGSSCGSTVRTVRSFNVERCGDEVRFTVEADGFLYNMVRIMAGTLLESARQDSALLPIEEIIASRDRAFAGDTLPARGLCLLKANYDGD